MSQFCPVFYPNLHAGLLILFTGIFSAKSSIKFTVSLTITSHKNVDDFLASFLCNTRIPTDVLIDHLLIVLLHRQGRIISGRGQGAKLRAQRANYFCLPSKNFAPLLKASKGTNLCNPFPKNQ